MELNGEILLPKIPHTFHRTQRNQVGIDSEVPSLLACFYSTEWYCAGCWGRQAILHCEPCKLQQ